jgi:hypothetical protein
MFTLRLLVPGGRTHRTGGIASVVGARSVVPDVVRRREAAGRARAG